MSNINYNSCISISKKYVEDRPLLDYHSLISVNVGSRISFRLYRDTRPHYLEISPLHKGLVLLLNGKELIEEGTGFGVPVVKYEDKTYFSSSADSTAQLGERNVLVKSFIMDSVSRKRLGKSAYINESFYSFFHSFFEKTYLNWKKLTFLFNAIMELRRILKVETDFVKAAPRGTITLTYTCFPDKVKINVDLTRLNCAKCKQILLLNEQGSNFFRKYVDSDGLALSDQNIGAWAIVKAEEASLSDFAGSLTFTLGKVKANTAQLFRGWESTRGRFSWAGLSYSLRPEMVVFDYIIKLRVR